MKLFITSDNTFSSDILNNHKYLLDFWAPWCGPCRAFSGILEKAHDKFYKSIKFFKIDIDSNPKIVSKYNVKTIPMIMFFNNGVIVDKKIGMLDYEGLKNFINQCVIKK